MKKSLPSLAMALLLTLLSAKAEDQMPRILLKGPVIVAFFANSEADDSDVNEALADFRSCAKGVRDPLSKRGIEFREVYAQGFAIVDKKSVTPFVPAKNAVGYYLIAPGHKPRVEYGVLTDSDLLQRAYQYFGTRSK